MRTLGLCSTLEDEFRGGGPQREHLGLCLTLEDSVLYQLGGL